MRRSITVRKGFTLVEILIVVIILGILAAIVIPQFTNASTAARQSNLSSQLQTLRSQIQLFKLQHQDAPPKLATGAGWTLLTQTTDTSNDPTPSGATATDTTHPNGPYLPSPAVNPLTNSDTFGTTATSTTGWVYDEATGEIHGVAPDPNNAGSYMKTDDGVNAVN